MYFSCSLGHLPLVAFHSGLKTKIIANGMQGLMFSVLWKAIDDAMKSKKK